MISQTNVPIMKKAVNVIYDMSEDTKIREIARLREKALHDEASALKNAKAEGMAEGIEVGMAKGMAKGIAKERADAISRMRALGFTAEQVRKMYPES